MLYNKFNVDGKQTTRQSNRTREPIKNVSLDSASQTFL